MTKTLYHYTSFNAFKSIVTHKGLNFRASRYSNYENEEYEWIKNKAYIAVKEMCQEQGVSFEDVFVKCTYISEEESEDNR